MPAAENTITKVNKNHFANNIRNSYFDKMLKSHLFRHSVLAAFNQALISGANFLVALILVRNATKEEYGYYSFAFAVMLFLVSVQNSIVTTPLSVLLVTKKNNTKSDYVSSLLTGQILFVVSLTAISFISIYIIYGNAIFNNVKVATIASLSIAMLGVLLREFYRAYAYADEKPKKVLFLDLKYILIYLLLIIIMYVLNFISTPVVFILMGISALFSPAMTSLGLKLNKNLNLIKKSYKENWQFGRWSLLGVIITHIQTYSYIYLLSILIGSSAVADASASKLLLMPVVLLQTGWGNVVRPYGARLREENKLKQFFYQQIKISIVAFILIIIYTIVIYFLSDFLSEQVFTLKYKQALKYIVFWGVIFSMNFIRLNASNALQVVKDFKHITIYNFFSMIITIVLSYLLIKEFGVVGSLIAFAIGEFTLALLLWYQLKKNININFTKK